jgi:integrase
MNRREIQKQIKDLKRAEENAESTIMIVAIVMLRILLLASPLLLFILLLGAMTGQWSNIDWDMVGLYLLVPTGIGILGSIISMVRNYRYVTKERATILKDARALVKNSNIYFFKYYKGGDALKNLKINKINPTILQLGYVKKDKPGNIWVNWAAPVTKKGIVNIVAHEMVHLLQMNHYESQMYMYNILNFHMGYDRNPMEIEARSVEKGLFNGAEKALDSARNILDVYQVYVKNESKKAKRKGVK